MADSASTKTTPLIHSMPEFTSDVYATIHPSELVVFAVYTLQDDGHYSAIEEIVSACFRLFPHRFSLKNYFYWPDSALITSYLIEAKRKGDLKGDTAEGFAVKVQGRQTIKRVAKILGVTLPAPEKKTKKPVSALEIKNIEPAKPAEIKVEVVEDIKATQAAPSEKPTKKKVVEKQLAKSSAKKAPAKKQATAPKKKKSTAPVKAKVSAKKKVLTVSKEKKSATVPVKKKTSTQPKKKISAKQAKPVKRTPAQEKSLPKRAPVKQEPLLQVKAEESKKKEQSKLVAVTPIRKMPAPKKETPQKQAPVKSAQPAQLTMALPIVEEKKTKPAQLIVQKVEPKPVKVEKVIAPAVVLQVSKEEKAKAGKVVQVMERSDAYRQYRKNGDRTKISEFDFRSLLLCTMESSPETLARNVNTFKGYANIQNRQDLVTFLNFVESSFSGLLNSSGKKLAKKR